MLSPNAIAVFNALAECGRPMCDHAIMLATGLGADDYEPAANMLHARGLVGRNAYSGTIARTGIAVSYAA